MMATAQTEATKRYEKKAGIIAKSFKLRRELADEFKETCDRVGVSQANQISKMMKEFIEENKQK